MGGWQLTLMQATFSSLPAAALIALAKFLQKTDEVRGNSQFEFVKGLFDHTSSILGQFLAPIYLAIIVFVAAKGSLPGGKASPDAVRRARSAYLYLNGAYGLWPQMGISFFNVVVQLLSVSGFNLLWKVLSVLALAFAAYQFWITSFRIPKTLIDLNGYPGDTQRNGGWRFWRRFARYWMWVWSCTILVLSLLVLGPILIGKFFRDVPDPIPPLKPVIWEGKMPGQNTPQTTAQQGASSPQETGSSDKGRK